MTTATAKAAGQYDRERERLRRRHHVRSAAGRDIGAIPAVVDHQRRTIAAASLRAFAETYFAPKFTLAWSDDHLLMIDKIEQIVLRDGLAALAMPRGSGKTTICEVAVMWATLNGHHVFTMLIGNSEAHALAMLANIKTELQYNAMLAEDYPEACYPIRRLEGETRRCAGQRHHGRPTNIEWAADHVTLATVPGARCSGAIVHVAGLTGNLRGAVHTRPDGRSVRPSLAIIDDPQTDQSARSPSQCAQREAVINGAVLGLAGPGRRMAVVVPCTVIRPNDMADQLLNRDLNPQWRGERTRMLYAEPTETDLWDQYAQLRAEAQREDREPTEATEFYRDRREAMDAGALVGWAERYNPDELSAIQHAMNLKFHDPASFASEYQNDPLPEGQSDAEVLGADELQQRLNGVGRAKAPSDATVITAFIDVQRKALFWLVAAWTPGFTGYIIDYGTYPDQAGRYFNLRTVTRTLGRVHAGAGLEGCIHAGLEALCDDLLTRDYPRGDGTTQRIERCLIDANWGESTETVYKFIARSVHRAALYPSHGRYIGASNKPLNEYTRKPGDRRGTYWRIASGRQARRKQRHALYDTNYWKSFIHTRFATAVGDRGSLSLYGRDPREHRLIADHMIAEYPVSTEAGGRFVDEWKQRPDKPDNHWFDCIVGAAVAASIAGVELAITTPEQRRQQRKAKDRPTPAGRPPRRRRGVSSLHI